MWTNTKLMGDTFHYFSALKCPTKPTSVLCIDCKVPSGRRDLTVYFGAPPAEPTPLALASLEQAVVHVPNELLQLREGRVHDVRSGFTQYPRRDPPLRAQGHQQQQHRADTQRRGHRERYPLPQRRHLRGPWCPRGGNTTPGRDRDAHLVITMSLL